MGTAEPGGERTTALVVEAESPLDNVLKLGKQARGTVRILAGEGPDQIYTAGSLVLDKEHWLVPGMEIPVSIDRSKPEDFEIAWDEIPSMAELAAQNHPALADPVGTRKRMSQAVIGATSAIDTSAMPAELAQAVAAEQARSAEPVDTLDQQLAAAAQAEAPAGKQRGIVLVATSLTTLYQDSEEAGVARSHRTSEGKHDTVLSVHLPGQEPYAVYKEKFKHPRREKLALGAAIPALVSLSDPSDVEVLWKEAAAAGSAQLSGKIAAAQEQMQQASGLEQAMLNAQQEAIKQGPPPGLGAGAAPHINPQMRQMMIQNAKMALANCPPQMRAMMIQQYRMAGIEIDDQGNVLE
jgi:hypothetical protein